MSLTREIKDFALDLGYSKAGVTTADPFTRCAEDMHSRYAAWALGRLGGAAAKAAVEKALSQETDESAKGEMESALAV